MVHSLDVQRCTLFVRKSAQHESEPPFRVRDCTKKPGAFLGEDLKGEPDGETLGAGTPTSRPIRDVTHPLCASLVCEKLLPGFHFRRADRDAMLSLIA